MGSRRPNAPVLVVEDNHETQVALRMVLETQGYAVQTAMDGQEALDYLRASRPACLVILDLRMPIMDGWAFLQTVQRDATLAQIPVIAFSANVERDLPGTVATIRKASVDPELFLRVIEAASQH